MRHKTLGFRPSVAGEVIRISPSYHARDVALGSFFLTVASKFARLS